jgi:hypothetical protein
MVDIQKRSFVAKLVAALVALPAGLFASRHFAFAQGAHSVPGGPPQSQGIPGAGSGKDDSPLPAAATDPKIMLKQHQQQIHDDVEKLFALATELKDEVEKTETEHVLSLPMIQKAEQIEKLAKQVKNLARGD